MILIGADQGYVYVVSDNKEPAKRIGLPMISHLPKEHMAGIFTQSVYGLIRAKFGWNYQNEHAFFAYDTISNKFIISDELSEVIGRLVGETTPEDTKDAFLKFISQAPDPIAFKEGVNKYLADNAAGSFNVTKSTPLLWNNSYMKYDFKKGSNETVTEQVVGMKCDISFDGKPQIGVSGRDGGYVIVSYDKKSEKFKMINSAWCQRVSSWSKNQLGVIDQLYGHWDLAEWLSGPYAEKCGLSAKEAPIVFFGNKSAVSRTEAMNMLQERMKAAKAKMAGRKK
jgi:hypothetical protein